MREDLLYSMTPEGPILQAQHRISSQLDIKMAPVSKAK